MERASGRWPLAASGVRRWLMERGSCLVLSSGGLLRVRDSQG